MQIHRNEITTGLLVLVTFGIFIAVLATIGMPGIIKPINTYRVYFDNANGIHPGDPVLLAGREIGKVTILKSPVPLENRPKGHPDYEVSIDVQVDRDAQIYRKITVHLGQQGLMGQEVIDFVHGDPPSGLADNHAEFVGSRIPDVSEAATNTLNRLTGPGSDLAATITNAEQFTDTLKREPWRLIWPSTKEYPDDKTAKDTGEKTAKGVDDKSTQEAGDAKTKAVDDKTATESNNK